MTLTDDKINIINDMIHKDVITIFLTAFKND